MVDCLCIPPISYWVGRFFLEPSRLSTAAEFRYMRWQSDSRELKENTVTEEGMELEFDRTKKSESFEGEGLFDVWK